MNTSSPVTLIGPIKAVFEAVPMNNTKAIVQTGRWTDGSNCQREQCCLAS